MDTLLQDTTFSSIDTLNNITSTFSSSIPIPGWGWGIIMGVIIILFSGGLVIRDEYKQKKRRDSK